jgi:hypothetical protein
MLENRFDLFGFGESNFGAKNKAIERFRELG